jgi:hypothetical protein
MIFGYTRLGSVPGFFGAAATLGPLFLSVAYVVWRSRRRDQLFLPFVLWTLMLGTYGLPISHDYNLFFLLLTALCLWDKRDPVLVHLMMLTALVWWQPLELGFVSIAMFVYLKFLAIIPVTILLIVRARQRDAVEPEVEPAAAAIPAARPEVA